jgi:hypothetical protein
VRRAARSTGWLEQDAHERIRGSRNHRSPASASGTPAGACLELRHARPGLQVVCRSCDPTPGVFVQIMQTARGAPHRPRAAPARRTLAWPA